ncbi:PHP domain-containing protein [Natronolimnobius sp. AArcel1]|uniref:PHP domain-containing protein n=1 Tax=Natronolimnobius sp. AArcel1 TaxID=1679093 RepID=UPI0013EC8A04|nr:PHP domain-containing protein [Natronolimnobius sp. AArcel1]NGM68628.1 PHP domain-containing protein [Natronolimnobius sp. AArcel1]
MPYADLHVHTTRSDGSLERDEVPAVANKYDVSVVALTDHDRLQPVETPVVEREGVTIINGIELRVEVDEANARAADDGRRGGQRVDLLGYGVEQTSDLEALVERIQSNRIERGQAIVENVEDRLGIELPVTVDDGFGRPHVARAIHAHPETEYDYEGAFDDLIGNDGPCFVPRDIPTFEHGQAVLTDACALVGLAHPLRYPDPEAALALTTDLEAVERWYPYGTDVDHSLVERAREENNLFATGGSDAHGTELGIEGLARAAYQQLPLSTE